MAAGFSSTDVALEGFRITKERPSILLAWGIVTFVFSLIAAGAMLAISGPALMRLQALGPEASSDPAVALELMRQLLPAYAVAFLITLLYYPILMGAGNRAVLTPENRSFGYLRLGKSELLQFGFLLALICILAVAYLIVILVTVALDQVATHLGVFGISIRFFAVVAGYCALIWIGVRLSLASSATFASGKLGILRSWELTRGRFWPLFGAYALAAVLMIVMMVLMLVVIGAIAALLSGSAALMAHGSGPAGLALGGVALLGLLLQFVLWVGILALWHAVWICGPAYAYRQIAGREGVAATSTFN